MNEVYIIKVWEVLSENAIELGYLPTLNEADVFVNKMNENVKAVLAFQTKIDEAETLMVRTLQQPEYLQFNPQIITEKLKFNVSEENWPQEALDEKSRVIKANKEASDKYYQAIDEYCELVFRPMFEAVDQEWLKENFVIESPLCDSRMKIDFDRYTDKPYHFTTMKKIMTQSLVIPTF